MILGYITIARKHLIQIIDITSTMIFFLILRRNDTINNSQQTSIINNITETSTYTLYYIDNIYLNNNKRATVILNPTPSLNEQLFMYTGINNI